MTINDLFAEDLEHLGVPSRALHHGKLNKEAGQVGAPADGGLRELPGQLVVAEAEQDRLSLNRHYRLMEGLN